MEASFRVRMTCKKLRLINKKKRKKAKIWKVKGILTDRQRLRKKMRMKMVATKMMKEKNCQKMKLQGKSKAKRNETGKISRARTSARLKLEHDTQAMKISPICSSKTSRIKSQNTANLSRGRISSHRRTQLTSASELNDHFMLVTLYGRI